MQDPSEEVEIRAFDGLGGEEIVLHEGYSVSEIWIQFFTPDADYVGFVLDDKFHRGVLLGEGYTHSAV